MPIICCTYFKNLARPVAQKKTSCCRRINTEAIKVDFDDSWLREMSPHKFIDGGGRGRKKPLRKIIYRYKIEYKEAP